MNLKKTIFVFFSSICLASAVAQSSIEYKPKPLLKALQKAGITDISSIKEIILPESMKMQETINGKYFEISNNNTSHYKYIYVGRVNSCRASGCSITNAVPNDGASEYFDYYILYDRKKTVQVVKVYNYQASHGQEISAKGWLKQFIGHDGTAPLEVEKNVDAISGATISVYAITIDIEMKTDVLHRIPQ